MEAQIKENPLRRLHWGCGDTRPSDWINSDFKEGPGIDLSGNILDGLPLEDESIEYISSQHALQQLEVYGVLTALRELHRVLKSGGVLRLCLPDFDQAIDAYRSGRRNYFWCWDWDTVSGNFITQVMDYNYTRTPLTYEFTAELLHKAGFRDVRRTNFKQTTSAHAEIVELDTRPEESFYVEAFKHECQVSAEDVLPGTPQQIHLSWTEDPSTSFTVTWQTPSRVDQGSVEYRVLGSETWKRVPGESRRSSGRGMLHQATITGSRPGTEHEYRVTSGQDANAPVSTIFQTRTAPPPGPADFSFAFICDTGLIGRLDGNATGTKQIIDELIADHPLFVLGGGDYAYANGDHRYHNIADAVDAWFVQMEPVIARYPFMAQYGNHEIFLEEKAWDWAVRFAHPAGFDHNKNYSFEVGDVHFTALFVPGPEISPEQLAWLCADLGDARRRAMRWLIVYQHEPIFAHGHSHPANPEIRKALTLILETHRVDLHLSGHDQNYERTYPLTEAQHKPRPTSSSLDKYEAGAGVIYAKVSPSGKMSDIRNDFSRFTKEQQPFIAVRDDTRHHYAIVSVKATGALVVDVYGLVGDGTPKTLVDSFSIVNAKEYDSR